VPVGALPGNAWIKVVYGWGYYSVDYGLSASVECDYACYVGVLPFAWSTGTIQPGKFATITHKVVVYGDIWLRGRADGDYGLTPIGPPTPMASRSNLRLREVVLGSED
jgi:hypothetical protein